MLMQAAKGERRSATQADMQRSTHDGHSLTSFVFPRRAWCVFSLSSRPHLSTDSTERARHGAKRQSSGKQVFVCYDRKEIDLLCVIMLV